MPRILSTDDIASFRDRLCEVATRQFAKRQRTWFRSKMRHWHRVRPID